MKLENGSVRLGLMLGVVFGIACAKPPAASSPEHCTTVDEWRHGVAVLHEMSLAHDEDGDGEADRWIAYLEFADHLSAVCYGINAYRGESAP